MQQVESSFKGIVALILSTAILACSSGDSASSDVLIFGGEEVATNEWQHVAALTSKRSNGTHEIICSATLISNRHILTAGHCLDSYLQASDRESALARFRIYFGPGEEGGNLPADAEVHPIGAAAVHPSLRLHPGGNADIAVLTLKERISAIKPTPIIASYDEFLQRVGNESAVKLIGFGRRENQGVGRKFMTDSEASKMSAWESVAGGDGRDACSGDSGGPGYVAGPSGQWTQYAIVSRGSSFQCGSGGVMTHIAPHACWIAEVTGLHLAGIATQCARAVSYAPKQLSAINFQSTCRGSKHTNRFQRETIKRLKIRFKTDDCDILELKLAEPSLNLDHLLLRDLSPLAPFANIEQLSLVNNLISAPEVLLQFPALKTLDVSGNDLNDPASELSALTARAVRIIGMTSQISNYGNTAFLRFCSDPLAPEDIKQTIRGVHARTMTDDCATSNSRLLMMTTLNLSERGLTNVAPLVGLPHLTSLDLSGNPISDLSPLSGLDRLKSLNISGTSVTDLSPLSELIDAGLVIKQ